MKPDWVDAPGWAKFLAKNKNGSWWWHENFPDTIDERGNWISNGCRQRADLSDGIWWSDSVEKRP